jgi:hypothetical protein
MPVPQPVINTGDSTILSSTVAICTTVVGRAMPVPRSAEPMPTRENCNASPGRYQCR